MRKRTTVAERLSSPAADSSAEKTVASDDYFWEQDDPCWQNDCDDPNCCGITDAEYRLLKLDIRKARRPGGVLAPIAPPRRTPRARGAGRPARRRTSRSSSRAGPSDLADEPPRPAVLERGRP
jgi:hypothetical protein